MIYYLSEKEIIDLNKYSLQATDELNEFCIIQPDDIRFLIKFVEKEFEDDLFKTALGYCISIIVLHPFKNGNHRTSLLSAEIFLLKNNFFLLSSNKEKIEFEKWRMNYEKENNLEKEFFRIAIIEDSVKRIKEIKKIMNSPYGKNTLKWLKNNYKEN
jgi:prophage maintenance system killer protein